MQYREPINVSEMVRELRRLWMLPLAVGLAMGLVFVALKSGSSALYEQRVDIVGSDTRGFADALGAPDVIERFDADVVARREQSKLEVLNRESGSSQRVRVQGSPQTSTVSVFGSGASPQAALDLANSYGAGIVEAQRSAGSERLGATRDQLQKDLDRIQSDLDADPDGNDSAHVLLLVDRASTVKLLAGLSAIESGGKGGVQDPEVIGAPSEIRRSSLVTYAALGLVLGLVLGCGFVVLRRVLSSAVYGEADLARYGSDVPVLADIRSSDRESKGIFAALAAACSQSTIPGRVPGVLFTGVGPNSVPENLPSGVLQTLPTLGIDGSAIGPDALIALDPKHVDRQFHVVVVDDGIRESSSAIACSGRLASTVVVVRRRKSSIAATFEALELVRQADGQLRGVVIVD